MQTQQSHTCAQNHRPIHARQLYSYLRTTQNTTTCKSKQTRKRDSQAELAEEVLREVTTAGDFSGVAPVQAQPDPSAVPSTSCAGDMNT